jgi:hypothetical protein
VSAPIQINGATLPAGIYSIWATNPQLSGPFQPLSGALSEVRLQASQKRP